MEPKIVEIRRKKLVGIREQMSLSNDKTALLWQKFMPRLHEIQNRINTRFMSMQVLPSTPASEPKPLHPDMQFEKWAAVEVTDNRYVPQSMEAYNLQAGQYAVFIHFGPANTFFETIQFIYGAWMPGSGYDLDCREHFEVLPEDYKPNDADAWEEVWIPIKPSKTLELNIAR